MFDPRLWRSPSSKACSASLALPRGARAGAGGRLETAGLPEILHRAGAPTF